MLLALASGAAIPHHFRPNLYCALEEEGRDWGGGGHWLAGTGRKRRGVSAPALATNIDSRLTEFKSIIASLIFSNI